MRTAVTLVRNHDAEAFEMLAGPEVPMNEQNEYLRHALSEAAKGPHPEIAEVQVWFSDSGLHRRVRFDKPIQ